MKTYLRISAVYSITLKNKNFEVNRYLNGNSFKAFRVKSLEQVDEFIIYDNKDNFYFECSPEYHFTLEDRVPVGASFSLVHPNFGKTLFTT